MARRLLLAAAAALLALPLAVAQTAMPDGCAVEDGSTGIVACTWEVVLDAGFDVPAFERPVPVAGNTVVSVHLHTESGNDIDWTILDNKTRQRITDLNSPEGDPRTLDFDWVVLLTPLPEHEPVVRIEQFMQNEEEFPEVNQFVPPWTHPAQYTFTFRFRPATGNVTPERPAGGPADLQLEDGVGDASSFYDLTGGWFDDPLLDDGLIETGLAVPNLRDFPPEGAEGYEYGLEWDLLGEHYLVLWGQEGALEPPIRAMQSTPAVLMRGRDDAAVRIMDVPALFDLENGTLRATLPVEALGSPSDGAEFSNLTAFSQRVAMRTHPFDPLGAETPRQGVERMDEATSMRRAFALGGPAVWSLLRGEAPPAPVLGQSPPPAAPVDPWQTYLPLGAFGLLLVGAVGAIVVFARRRAPAAVAPAVLPPEAGAVFLGKYHVERELGRGAFGSTWLAMHLNLRREVVIKQLHPENSALPEAIESFRSEARILASLDHPHVTRIHDVELVNRAWYIVMEYVDGGSLEDRLKGGPLPPEDAVRITSAILDGLAYIHEHGVLHLDLKPANVLLTSTGIVKIVDFGVSRRREPAARASGKTATPTGTSTGTALYLSPEQVRGAPPDERSDLYAVAVTFYELVTGRYYVEADTMDLFEIRRAIVEKAPLLPLPQLGPRLNAWLDRALAKKPEERFRTAAEMRNALRQAGGGATSVAVVERAAPAPGPAVPPTALPDPAERPRG